MLSSVWPGDCPLTQPWGCTPLLVEPWWAAKGCHWHCGVDVGMGIGTPLYAARGGIVINITYGLIGVEVLHETDWYVHVDRAADPIRFGQPVAAGELLCYSGAKVPAGGSLTGPHLHFETQSGALNNPATSLDPIPVLEGGYMAGTVGAQPWDSPAELQAYIAQTKSVLDHFFGTGGANTVPTVTLAQLVAQIKAIQSGSPSNLQPVLDAIANLSTQVAAIKSKTDKDLA